MADWSDVYAWKRRLKLIWSKNGITEQPNIKILFCTESNETYLRINWMEKLPFSWVQFSY